MAERWEDYFDPDETLLWQGPPFPRPRPPLGTIFLALFGLPFLGAGAAMVFGHWYMQANAHRKVRYALSNKRAYIATRWWSQKLQMIPIASDATVTLEGGRDVYFRTEVGKDNDGDRTTERKGF